MSLIIRSTLQLLSAKVRRLTKASCRKGRVISGLVAVGLSVCLLAGGKAEATSFSFTKVVDSNTPIPNGTGNFTFSTPPSLDNKSVAFLGVGSSQSGIYTTVGGSLNVVADSNTPIPGGTGNFGGFGEPSLNNGSVAFNGSSEVLRFPDGGFSSPLQEGIYTNVGGQLSVVADRNTPIPGSTENFVFFSSPSLNDESVAFVGERPSTDAESLSGIYTNVGGRLNIVAGNTPIPSGTEKFEPLWRYEQPSIENGSVAFLGSKGFQKSFRPGIYITVGDSLDVIADYNTPIPGGTGNFTGFDTAPSLNNGSVVFKGVGDILPGEIGRQEGIYTNIGGKLSVVADCNTPIPRGRGKFSGFGINIPAIDNGSVAFVGYGVETPNSQSGIYTNLGGGLTKVIDTNDSLDGKTLMTFSSRTLGREGFSGNQIAFVAEFTDGSQGIYIATLNPTSTPQSSAASGILAIGALGTGSILKRKYIL